MIIQANPGFFAVVKSGTTTLHLPVIAWFISADGILVKPITLGGCESLSAVVIGPDGKQAHE
jgi:hypothetical protein